MIIDVKDIKLLHIQLKFEDGALIVLIFKDINKFNTFTNSIKDFIIIGENLILNYDIIKIDFENLSVSINCEKIINDIKIIREIKLENVLNKLKK